MDLQQRKTWNENHKILTGMFAKPAEHTKAIDLFLNQHALLYVSQMTNSEDLTLEDELLTGMKEKTFRTYPVHSQGTKNSIVWHLWHSARIEDITMNILAVDNDQILHTDNYAHRMNAGFIHSGNGMSEEEVAGLSSAIDIDTLLAYRLDVGKRTRSIITSLQPEQLKAKISTERIKRLSEEKAVKASEDWLIEYWRNKSIAGLVLMPATRHNFIHLNKSMHIKHKLQG
ncbi:DinB family protein [Paenibacillus monticola]|uniref:DinB family protein n=1 Tax=Paenibacillus monticola TaxID=2666075 RepID=A0A7X2L3M1_9BACL|nr:DinB family protein [Paenibacillus monticola]MRN55569.1 DinB family protein [Paenibacillus monticola]